MEQRVKIIGSGVIGLTTAIELSDASHVDQISIVSSLDAEYASDKAAAFWYPFHVGGVDGDYQYSINELAEFALRRFRDQSRCQRAGISYERLSEYFQTTRQMMEWKKANPWSNLRELKFKELNFNEVPSDFACGISLTVPVIHMEVYLPYLHSILNDRPNVSFESRHVHDIFNELNGFDVLINCAGLGANELVGDKSVVPHRGQVVVIDPVPVSGLTFITQGEPYNDFPVYIVPRGEVDVLLGGTVDESASTVPDPITTENIIAACSKFEPSIQHSTSLRPRVGLRPFRTAGVRLGPDGADHRIIHNYGHGGAGVTLSWGCARRVRELIEQ